MAKAETEPGRAGAALPEGYVRQPGRQAARHPQSRHDNCRSDAGLRSPPAVARRDRGRKGWRRRHDPLLLGRIIGPRRERPVRFELPPIESAADLKAAMAAVTAAV